MLIKKYVCDYKTRLTCFTFRSFYVYLLFFLLWSFVFVSLYFFFVFLWFLDSTKRNTKYDTSLTLLFSDFFLFFPFLLSVSKRSSPVFYIFLAFSFRLFNFIMCPSIEFFTFLRVYLNWSGRLLVGSFVFFAQSTTFFTFTHFLFLISVNARIALSGE